MKDVEQKVGEALELRTLPRVTRVHVGPRVHLDEPRGAFLVELEVKPDELIPAGGEVSFLVLNHRHAATQGLLKPRPHIWPTDRGVCLQVRGQRVDVAVARRD